MQPDIEKSAHSRAVMIFVTSTRKRDGWIYLGARCLLCGEQKRATGDDASTSDDLLAWRAEHEKRHPR